MRKEKWNQEREVVTMKKGKKWKKISEGRRDKWETMKGSQRQKTERQVINENERERITKRKSEVEKAGEKLSERERERKGRVHWRVIE